MAMLMMDSFQLLVAFIGPWPCLIKVSARSARAGVTKC